MANSAATDVRKPSIGRTRVRRRPLSLETLQDRFQSAVLDGDDEILQFIPDSSRTSADVLLGVYRHAYRARLRETLAGDHPLLKRLMGDDAFEAMADGYITKHASRTQNVRWFSRTVPEFLRLADKYKGRPELSELAGLEQALGNAFDAADAPVLDVAALQGIAPGDWAGMTFYSHPAAARLDFSTNAFDLWKALKDEAPVPEVNRSGERVRLIVWRQEFQARVRPFAAEEAMMWDEAGRGVPFGRLCELVATFDDPETAALRAAQYLQGWIASGMLQGVEVSLVASE